MRYLFILLFLFGCEKASVKGDMDRTGSAQKITVIIHPTIQDMTRAKSKIEGNSPDKNDMAFAVWTNREADGCEIHLVQGSSEKDWGHELRHCMYGSFHEEL